TTLRWRVGPAEFATVGGITVGAFTAPQRWAQIRMRYRLSSKFAFAMAAGRASPIALSLDPRTAPRTQLCIQFAPLAKAAGGITPAPKLFVRRFIAASLHDGRAAIHVQCREARTLEVRSDLTEWQPVSMQYVTGGWWELVLAAEPGVHTIQIRMDNG